MKDQSCLNYRRSYDSRGFYPLWNRFVCGKSTITVPDAKRLQKNKAPAWFAVSQKDKVPYAAPQKT